MLKFLVFLTINRASRILLCGCGRLGRYQGHLVDSLGREIESEREEYR